MPEYRLNKGHSVLKPEQMKGTGEDSLSRKRTHRTQKLVQTLRKAGSQEKTGGICLPNAHGHQANIIFTAE